MFFLSFFRVIKFAFQDFFRNIVLSLVTVSIMILTFLSLASLIVLNAASQAAISQIENKIDISIIFKPEVEEYQLIDVQKGIAALPETANVDYMPKEAVLAEFKEKNKDKPDILDALRELDSNPFGAMFTVRAKTVTGYPKILEKLNDNKVLPSNYIQDKNFHDYREVIDKINIISKQVKRIGLIASLIFGLIALAIVFNTIGISIYTHKKTITIMKLVGATNWFIRAPFLLEGLLYGVLACVGSIVIVYSLLNLLQPYLVVVFQHDFNTDFNIITYFNQNFIKIFGLEFLTILVLNGLASAVAMRKYLKV